MSYDPNDHAITARQILAGWIVCLGIVGLAVAVTAERHPLSATSAIDPHRTAAATERCSMNGIRLPSFAACAAGRDRTVNIARGPMSVPAEPCG